MQTMLTTILLGLIAGASVLLNAGRAIITARLKGLGAEPSYVAWGTGAGTAAASDTTLFTEASESRVAGATSQQTVSVTNDAYRIVGTITAGGAKTITNAGCFDASSGGNGFIKGDFAGVPLNPNDSIQFTFQVQFT